MNLEDFLDKELDTGAVGSIDNTDRSEKTDKSSDDSSKKENSKGGIFSKGSRKKKFKAWFASK